jgi:uncharacterized protein (DUF58 family)
MSINSSTKSTALPRRRVQGNLRHGRLGARVSPDALMSIKSLELRAKVVVDGFLAGLHRSPHHGFSSEFSEYRQYSPGDDPRYLDWRLVARSDRYFIKRFEDETNLRCYFLVDLSRSMAYGSGGLTKADYARTVVATLAYFLSLQRDAVGLLTFADKILEYLPARFRPGHVHRLMLALEHDVIGSGTTLEAPIEQISRTVQKRGLVILLSDFLAPIDQLETHLGYLHCRGNDVMLVRVLDPVELSFSLAAPSLVEDLETGRRVYVDPEAAAHQYRQRFQRHADDLTRSAARLGIDLFQYTTDQPIEQTLFDFVHRRRGQVPQIRRRGPARGV